MNEAQEIERGEVARADARDAARAVGLFEDRYGATPPRGDLGSLYELLERFSHLPYENLTKIIAWDGGLTAPAPRGPLPVVEDHLRLGTGGTCFSLAELLRQLLRAAGFASQPLMAHMAHGDNIHCALRVEAGGRSYLVDPGYVLREPVPFDAGPSRPSGLLLAPVGSRPLPSGVRPTLAGELDLFTLEADTPRWRYRISTRAPSAAEFLEHWRRSFYQPGMSSLLASRLTEEGELLYLHNHKLRRQSAAAKSTLNVRADLEHAVADSFGIDPDVTRRAAAIIARVRAGWTRGARGASGTR
jgi:arylamine N-acetyltransferase